MLNGAVMLAWLALLNKHMLFSVHKVQATHVYKSKRKCHPFRICVAAYKKKKTVMLIAGKQLMVNIWRMWKLWSYALKSTIQLQKEGQIFATRSGELCSAHTYVQMMTSRDHVPRQLDVFMVLSNFVAYTFTNEHNAWDENKQQI